MEKRWSDFCEDDIMLGVRFVKKNFFVPDLHRDRMNAVAFYIHMLEEGHPHAQPYTHGNLQGFLMSQATFTELSTLVQQKITPEDEDVFYSDENQSKRTLSMMASKLRKSLNKIERKLSDF